MKTSLLDDQSDHVTSNHTATESSMDQDRDNLKRVRNIRKKLKQIEDLEQRISAGDIKPDRDQLNKISKKQELKDELASLTA